MKKLILLLTLLIVFNHSEAKKRFKYTYKMTAPVECDTLKFTDDTIDTYFIVGKNEVTFLLLNRLDQPVKVDWNGIMISIGGEAKKVMHSGITYADRNEYQVPTTIPPETRLKDFVMPTDNVYLHTGSYARWIEYPLLPVEAKKAEELEPLIGSEIGLYLPLTIGDKTVDYNFKFVVTGIEQDK